MKRTLLSFILLCVSTLAEAYDFFVDGIYYNKISNNRVEVTRGDADYSGYVNIPYYITVNGLGYTVISIGSSAFRNCDGLISVIIPNSVTSIGSEAFSYCSGLTTVTIGYNVNSIGKSSFSGCSSLTSITIPNNVTSIGSSAFSLCI